MDKFVLYMNIGDKIVEYILPGINNRKGELELYRETGIKGMRFSYEVWDGEWHFFTNKHVRFSKNHVIIEDLTLEDGVTVMGRAEDEGIRFPIMIQAVDSQKAVFKKYDIRSADRILIGKDNGCDIVLQDSFVSATHADLYKNGNGWYLTDKSTNGTYVNGSRVNGSVRLRTFDVISISGYKFVYLASMLAANHAGRMFSRLPRADISVFVSNTKRGDLSSFSRNPRRVEPLDSTEIEIEAPPAPEKKNKTPLIFTLGPSLTMPVPILAMVMFNIMGSGRSGNSSFSYFGMAISVIMFGAFGVMWALMRHRYDKRTSAENEAARTSAYNEYIGQNIQLIENLQESNRQIIGNNYKESNILAASASGNRFELWNRNVNHADFLTVRIGTGCMDSPNPIKTPKQRFSVTQDTLAAYPQQVYERYCYLTPVTRTIDLKRNKIIGMIGGARDISAVAGSILVQFSSLHSYRDAKVVVLSRTIEDIRLDWVRWLPHTFSNDRKIRYLANAPDPLQNVLYQLSDTLRKRQDGEASLLPHLFIVSTDKSLLEGESLYKYMTDETDYGATFLLLHCNMDALPNECKLIVECAAGGAGAVYRLDEAFTPNNAISRFDTVSFDAAEQYARLISGIRTNELDEGAIPDSVDYFDMMGIRRIDDWDLLKKYKENRSFEGLKGLVGVAAGGKQIILDIHEKKYGPHGLVAGTTGSGKSETIQAFVLSLALNYHPNEVAFVLIDYKGGGMANIFEGIPHIAGTITNVSSEEGDSQSAYDNQTRRALISIRSEIKRRETIFNKYKVNHIDQYMRLYREGGASEPIPHLIMISDEFAELKKEQPEFIKELVSTARVGRSLGIHLILATQKPAGVVDDEIWSNSRFKLCLRVQDKQDSMGMLKRPEAAYLTQTGRAYLQIGNDEIFEQFQSGYSGAKYDQSGGDAADEEGVTMIAIDGSPAYIHSKAKGADENRKTQIEVSVEYIAEFAVKEGIGNTPPLWLPMLPKRISLVEIEQAYAVDYGASVVSVAGLVDFPEKQSQYPLALDWGGMANLLIIGNTGSGKTSFAQTLLYSIARHYEPSEAQFYVMDFSSRTFKMFERLPHCGGVLFSEDEDGVSRLVGLLFEFIEARKSKLADAGVGSFVEYMKARGGLPMVFLVIDNYFELSQSYPDMEDQLMRLTRDGAKYGIQTMVTMNRLGDMRYKLVQNFNRVIPIQLSERGDYMETLGGSPEFMPSQTPGRGILMHQGFTLEYQSALPEIGDSEVERTKNMSDAIDARIAECVGEPARNIPILPVGESFGTYIEKHSEAAKEIGLLPLGYRVRDISLWGLDLRESYCFGVSSATGAGTANLLSNIALACRESGYEVLSARLNSGKKSVVGATLVDASYNGYDGLVELLGRLKEEFTKRSAATKGYTAENPSGDAREYAFSSFEKIFVLIDDMAAFADIVYKQTNEISLNEITETFFKQGAAFGVYFIGGFPSGIDSALMYLPGVKAFVEYRDAVHFEGKLASQKLIPCPLPISEQNKARGQGEGYASFRDEAEWVYTPMFESSR
jgi:S-DNA-T family DNA segregation ATPase FtsK/SpoIIIE